MVARVRIPENLIYDKKADSIIKSLKSFGYKNDNLVRVRFEDGVRKLELPMGRVRRISQLLLERLFDINPDPKYLELVTFVLAPQLMLHKDSYPFKHGEVLVWFGEIPQMPGHCVVANKEGRVIWGYHTEDFELVPNEES